MRLKRPVVIAVLVLGLMATVGTGIVAADPSNAKKGDTIEVDCGGQTLVVVVNGNGSFTPGHLVDSTGNLIPVTVTITVTDASGEVVFQEVAAKGGQRTGQQGQLFTCSFSETLDDPDLGELTLNGEVQVFRTPRNQK